MIGVIAVSIVVSRTLKEYVLITGMTITIDIIKWTIESMTIFNIPHILCYFINFNQ